jgi:hypothetical protein
MRLRRRPIVLLLLLVGCGSSHGGAGGSGGGHAVPGAATAPLLRTYAQAGACASVGVDTPIDRVPPPCQAAWRPYGVTVVPGQDLLHKTPAFPPATAGPGVSVGEAADWAAAYWRSEAFKWFALRTRQVGIVDGLGLEGLYRRASKEVALVAAGGTVQTPPCHAFPTALRVVVLDAAFAALEHRAGRTLGVMATFTGPCTVSGVDAGGQSHQLYSLDGRASFVMVGDVIAAEPLGRVLRLSGLGECQRAEVAATCKQSASGGG